jgi:hypothetical protein
MNHGGMTIEQCREDDRAGQGRLDHCSVGHRLWRRAR